MAKGNTANEAKKDMLVSGVCEFYGQTDNYDGDGKEYKLCIKDPEFKHLDWETIESWYTDKKGNVKKALDSYYNTKEEAPKVEEMTQTTTL